MNHRLFSIALLVSALPLYASAGVNFDKSDFVSAKTIVRNGEEIVSVKLSKSGKAKLKKANEAVGESVHSEIAGVSTDFKLKEPIKGDGLEMGPYSGADAEKVVAEINKGK